jgi:hypothetical protein
VDGEEAGGVMTAGFLFASCSRELATGAPALFSPPSALPFCRPPTDCAVIRNSRSIGMPPSASGNASEGTSGRIYAEANASPVVGVKVKVGRFESDTLPVASAQLG